MHLLVRGDLLSLYDLDPCVTSFNFYAYYSILFAGVEEFGGEEAEEGEEEEAEGGEGDGDDE